ncbi:hypothetical protein ACTL6U_20290 [Rhodovibrionaceae bacterium A322]
MTFIIGDTGPTSDSTSDYPYSAVVYITATFADGSTSTGTGLIVDDNNVLTASSLLMPDGTSDSRATSVTITPGLDGTKAPFGSYTTSSFYANFWDENGDRTLDNDEALNDYAVVGFDQKITSKGGATTTGSIEVASTQEAGGFNITGYSDNYINNGPRMTSDYGYASFTGEGRFSVFGSGVGTNTTPGEFELDASMIGSPLWYYNNGTPYTYGLVSYVSDSGTGYGPNYSGDTYDQIMSVMNDHKLLLADNDDYTGTSSADTKESGDGYDTLRGEAGNDYLQGNQDSDLLYGGNDDDTLRGGQGDDTLHGDAGEDSLYGDIGSDKIYGGDGDDFINGGRISSYEGNDSDTIYGGAGNDFLQANLADDRAYGDDGEDTVRGGGGNDSLWGGNDNDLLYGDKGSDKIWGGDGTDTARFQGNMADYFIDDIGSDNYTVTHIAGVYGEDTVYGDVEVLQFDDGTMGI